MIPAKRHSAPIAKRLSTQQTLVDKISAKCQSARATTLEAPAHRDLETVTVVALATVHEAFRAAQSHQPEKNPLYRSISKRIFIQCQVLFQLPTHRLPLASQEKIH